MFFLFLLYLHYPSSEGKNVIEKRESFFADTESVRHGQENQNAGLPFCILKMNCQKMSMNSILCSRGLFYILRSILTLSFC